MTNKEKVIKLIGELKSDIGSWREINDEIIKICKPIIKKFYNVAKHYSTPSYVGWTTNYFDFNYGILSEVYSGDEDSITFTYVEYDGPFVLFEEEITMPLSWLDPNSLEEYKKFCKEKEISRLEWLIEYNLKEFLEKDKKLKEALEIAKAK